MAERAFDGATWIPGEPLDPNNRAMPVPEISDRLLWLEKALNELKVGDLPMPGVMRSLEQDWLPDPSTLFPSGSINFDSLRFTDFYGQVSAAGNIQISGSGQWTSTRTGAGAYTVNFPTLHSIPIVIAVPAANVTGFRVSAKTTATFNVSASGDTDFDFIVRGK